MLQSSSAPFLKNTASTNAADFTARYDLGKGQKQGFWKGQNLWTVHFVRAGPLSTPISLGVRLVVLSVSQTTTTTCLR